MSQDYYSVLGLPRDATSQDIKRAFRQIARECHPDVSGGDQRSEERFKQARTAYETLMDPVARARYDRRGQRRSFDGGSFFDAFYKATGQAQEQAREQARPRGPSAGSSHASGPQRKRRHDPGNNLDLEDLFNDFGDFGFGGGRMRSSAGAGASAQPPPGLDPTPGDDVHIDVEVPARVARDGGSLSVTYHRMQRSDGWRPGSADHGLARVEDIAEVRIIPGTVQGAVLRERGLGDAGAWGGTYGDLVARVVITGSLDDPPPVQPEPGLQSLDISVVEALLGGRIQLDTPQGPVRVTIPAGTSSGSRLRLKQRGPDGPDGRPTDLFVEIRIVVPRRLDDESRELVERFAQLNPWDPRSG